MSFTRIGPVKRGRGRVGYPQPAAGLSPAGSPRAPESGDHRGVRWPLWLLVPAGLLWPAALSGVEYSRADIWGIDRNAIATLLDESVESGSLPRVVDVPVADQSGPAEVRYTLDPALQRSAAALLQEYRPDYGIYVALDADSGAILAMVSSTRDEKPHGNLALQNTYPAASVFKLVTAAAAIDQGKATATTVVPYNGSASSLYKKNVLAHRDGKWTQRPTLQEAFGKSVNTVFARLGVDYIGGAVLDEYAQRFGFNDQAQSDLPVPLGSTRIDPANPWSVAEAASGYTRSNTLSPLHGAMLAAAVANDGLMSIPFMVESVSNPQGIVMYAAETDGARAVMKPQTARELRALMRETVHSGTASRHFKGFFSGPLAAAEVGGKTGSLTGTDPPGKYDWFVGYAELGGRRIAYAAVCINVEKWYVKSAYFARRMLETYFSDVS